MSDLRSSLKLKPSFEGLSLDMVSALLSSRRTELSLHRTRMSADRTLMSIVRTSLSLIAFGFTIFQFFRTLRTSTDAARFVPAGAPRNFGMALVFLGVLIQLLGIWNHGRFMLHLRTARRELTEAGLITEIDKFPASPTLIVAVALALIGVVALFNMITKVAGS